MALLVEDGTGITNADSYVNLTTFRAFTLKYGTDLSAVADSVLDIVAYKVMDHIENMRDEFQGWKTSNAYALQFPRENVYIDDFLVENDTMHSTLLNAQMQLMLDVQLGFDLDPNTTDNFAIEEKIGPITIKNSDKIRTSNKPKSTKFLAFITPLLKNTGGGFTVGRR